MEKNLNFSEKQKVNQVALIAYIVLNSVFLAAYLIEVLKGGKTVFYFLAFLSTVLIPTVLCVIAYRRNKECSFLRYIMGIGHCIMYIFTLFTGSTRLTFTYVIPFLVIITLYAHRQYSSMIGAAAILTNIAFVAYSASVHGMGKQDVVEAEIQIISIVLVVVFSIVCTAVVNKINSKKLEVLDQERSLATKLLDTTLEVSGSIVSDINHVKEQMKKLGKSANDTRHAMSGVSDGAADTANQVQTQLIMTEQIQEFIREAETVSNTIVENVSDVKSAIHHGQSGMDSLIAQVNKSEEASLIVSKDLDELNEYTGKMQSIVDMIDNITAQTSLLSLNASIEAARAGEAGKGFAVVAMEISKLANQTQDATVDITQLINNIFTSLKEVVDATSHLIESNQIQNQYANEVAGGFEAISSKSVRISEQSEKLGTIMTELSEANTRIVESVQNISAITEEVSAHATQTYSVSEENAEVVESISGLVDNLSVQANKFSEVTEAN